MQLSHNFLRRLLQLGALFFLSLALAGCAVKMVADYDSAAFEEILAVGKKVDRFYGTMLETDAAQRAYPQFSAGYVDIESDIRALAMRNKARAFNEESSRISEIILNLWLKYKTAHKAKNAYPDGMAKLDRDRFARLFASAASAEQAKRLDPDDKDVAQDSK